MKRDVLKTIDERMSTFSKGQKKISIYIKEKYEQVAYMTAAKLGHEVGISESTVVRFVTELGYDGYRDFQRSLQEMTKTKLTSSQRVQITSSLIGDGRVLDNVLESDIENIKHTLENIDPDAFELATEKILAAKHIYIIGMRACSYLAGFLNYSLRMTFDNVRMIQTTSGSETFEQMIDISEGDVMIAISFPRYSKSVIRAANFARSSGADVISITDSLESPISNEATAVLIAQSDMASYMDSLVAPMSVINALITSLTQKRQEHVVSRLEHLEQIWDEYNIYDKTVH